MEYASVRNWCAAVSINHFAVGYKGTMVEEYLGMGSGLGFAHPYAYEETLLGTAGAIGNAGRFYHGGRFFVLNADTFYQIHFTYAPETLDS